MTKTGDAATPESWIVVCVQCLRIKRGDRWTDQKADSTAGRSTGYCDKCVTRRRKSLEL
jgi:hypothetical protein